MNKIMLVISPYVMLVYLLVSLASLREGGGIFKENDGRSLRRFRMSNTLGKRLLLQSASADSFLPEEAFLKSNS